MSRKLIAVLIVAVMAVMALAASPVVEKTAKSAEPVVITAYSALAIKLPPPGMGDEYLPPAGVTGGFTERRNTYDVNLASIPFALLGTVVISSFMRVTSHLWVVLS